MSSEMLRQDIPDRLGFPSLNYLLALSVVGGIALATCAVHCLHLSTTSEGPVTIMMGSLIPMALSLGLLGVITWLHWHRREKLMTSIGIWCVFGTLVLVGVSVLSVTYQSSQGVEMRSLRVVIANHAAVGAVLGTLLGLYDGQRRDRTDDFRTQRERARRLSNRLTVLNRLFRHDIRNAVNVIRGNTELIRSGSEEVDTLTDTIDGKAAELLELSERARKIERLFDKDSVSGSKIDVAPTLQAKAHALENDHPEFDIQTEIPESLAIRSIPLIEDAVDELLHNAVTHNDAEKPRISISASAATAGTGFVTIQISDNGSGIPDTEVAPLERGRETDLEHASGIGLWFVHWVVERSGGELEFEDREKRGSVVTIRLPEADD